MKRQPRPGIYLITNIINWKRYVGKDADLPHRWGTHKSELKLGKHGNPHLQRSWNLYGEAAFIYSIIRYCKKSELVEWEQFYMDLYDTYNNPIKGYNERKADGSEYSKEVRINISAAQVGKTHTPESNEKRSVALKNKPWSAERRAAESINPWVVTNPEGCERVVDTLSQICRENGLDSGCMSKVAAGIIRQHKGWKCRRVSTRNPFDLKKL